MWPITLVPSAEPLDCERFLDLKGSPPISHKETTSSRGSSKTHHPPESYPVYSLDGGESDTGIEKSE
jgi:hypothetical protein